MAYTETNILIKEGFQKQQEQLHEFQQKLEKQQHNPLPVQKHLHSIELKSSKVVIALVSLCVALLCSMSCNIYQFSANSRLNDNDIKFRYIKAFGEIIQICRISPMKASSAGTTSPKPSIALPASPPVRCCPSIPRNILPQPPVRPIQCSTRQR